MKRPSHLCSILLFSALTFSGSAAAQSPPSNLPEEPQASNLAIPLPAVQQGIRSRLAELTIDQKTISTTHTAYGGCGLHGIQQRLGDHASTFFYGVRSLPRNAIRVENLKWELPVMATTVLLIEKGDIPAADRIKSRSLVDNSDKATNIGLGAELGAGALAYGAGCWHNNSRFRETGFTALTAMGEAGLVDLAMKFSFDRQFPRGPGVRSTGDFWGGGRSFPSGHAATSFAFASAVVHRYPEKKWVKWGAYGLATGVSVLRVPAKHHFPSDIVIGGALGYVIGAYAADHGRQ